MPFTSPSPINTPQLQLRLVEEDDISDLFEVNGDDTVTRFLPYPSWQSLENGKAWFDRMSAQITAGTTLQFVIIEKESGHVIGSCLLFRYEEASARAEIGYVMGRAHWNKGFTHEALSGLIDHAFDVCELRRLEAEVDPRNIASNRLLLKLGFTCEGLLRQRWVTKGNINDTNIYGLLRDEWLSVS
jgi:RimJ/RimL family protein N-acetyltransferase